MRFYLNCNLWYNRLIRANNWILYKNLFIVQFARSFQVITKTPLRIDIRERTKKTLYLDVSELSFLVFKRSWSIESIYLKCFHRKQWLIVIKRKERMVKLTEIYSVLRKDVYECLCAFMRPVWRTQRYALTCEVVKIETLAFNNPLQVYRKHFRAMQINR